MHHEDATRLLSQVAGSIYAAKIVEETPVNIMRPGVEIPLRNRQLMDQAVLEAHLLIQKAEVFAREHPLR